MESFLRSVLDDPAAAPLDRFRAMDRLRELQDGREAQNAFDGVPDDELRADVDELTAAHVELVLAGESIPSHIRLRLQRS